MIGAIATVTEVWDDFDKYLNLVMAGKEVVLMENEKEIGRFIPKSTTVSALTDSLTGVLNSDIDMKAAKTERLKAKYKDPTQDNNSDA